MAKYKDGYVKLNGKEVSKQILFAPGTKDLLKDTAKRIAADVNSNLGKVKDENETKKSKKKVLVREKAKVVRTTKRKKRAAFDVVAPLTKETVENHLLEKAAARKR